MKKSQRILAAFSTLLLLCSSLLSCSQAETEETPAPVNPIETTLVEETQEERIDPGLPALDLNGYTINFFGKNMNGIDEEETTGEGVVDAIYNRNILLEDTYNFEIITTEITNPNNTITEAIRIINAGDDSYQVLVDGGNRFVQLITEGIMYDMNTMVYQDFTQPWWYQNLNQGVSLNGKLFMTVADFLHKSLAGVYHPIVNADLALDLGVTKENLYQSVRDGKWTLDAFTKLCELGSSDLNGDGTMNDRDQWGFQTEAYSGYAIALGCGFRIASKDEQDIPYISIAAEQSVDLWDTLCSLIFKNKDMFLVTQNITGVSDVWSTSTDMRNEGRVLVAFSSLSDNMRTWNYDYAVLPSPKANEDQEFYYHTASSWNAPMLGIPISVQDPDTVSFILEAMAYESYYSVLPEFYNNYLETKLVRDQDSIEMLQIIYSSIYYDPGAVYNWGAFLNDVYEVVKTGENNLARIASSKARSSQKEIQLTLKSIEK